jgi:hypothetical protein
MATKKTGRAPAKPRPKTQTTSKATTSRSTASRKASSTSVKVSSPAPSVNTDYKKVQRMTILMAIFAALSLIFASLAFYWYA